MLLLIAKNLVLHSRDIVLKNPTKNFHALLKKGIYFEKWMHAFLEQMKKYFFRENSFIYLKIKVFKWETCFKIVFIIWKIYKKYEKIFRIIFDVQSSVAVGCTTS